MRSAVPHNTRPSNTRPMSADSYSVVIHRDVPGVRHDTASRLAGLCPCEPTVEILQGLEWVEVPRS